MAGNGGECGLKSSIVEGLVYGAGQEPILRLPFQGWTSSRFGIRCSQPRQAAWAYLLLPVSNLRRIAYSEKRSLIFSNLRTANSEFRTCKRRTPVFGHPANSELRTGKRRTPVFGHPANSEQRTCKRRTPVFGHPANSEQRTCKRRTPVFGHPANSELRTGERRTPVFGVRYSEFGEPAESEIRKNTLRIANLRIANSEQRTCE